MAFLLLLITISHGIDLHGFSHVFEDAHEDDAKHCELCIINYQKDQNAFALEPTGQDFELPLQIKLAVVHQKISTEQPTVKTHFFSGQLFNRPPPQNI